MKKSRKQQKNRQGEKTKEKKRNSKHKQKPKKSKYQRTFSSVFVQKIISTVENCVQSVNSLINVTARTSIQMTSWNVQFVFPFDETFSIWLIVPMCRIDAFTKWWRCLQAKRVIMSHYEILELEMCNWIKLIALEAEAKLGRFTVCNCILSYYDVT